MLLAAAFALPAKTAEADDDDAGAWLVFAASGPLPEALGSGGVSFAIDLQARYFDVGSGANQQLVRPSVAYALDDHWSVHAGYARLRTRPRSGPTVTEDRLWEQLSWRGTVADGASLGVRLRAEHRFLSIGDEVGQVLRVQLSYARPIGSHGNTDLVVSIEPFLELRDTDYGARTGVSQNRIYLGLRWPLSGKASLSAGYLNQRFFRDDAEDIDNHLALVGLETRF